jgi:hypothetical protein
VSAQARGTRRNQKKNPKRKRKFAPTITRDTATLKDKNENKNMNNDYVLYLEARKRRKSRRWTN